MTGNQFSKNNNKQKGGDFPGGPEVKDLLANARDTGSSPVQEDSTCCRARACAPWSLCSSSSSRCRDGVPQLETRPRSSQLEKACTQQRRPSTDNNSIDTSFEKQGVMLKPHFTNVTISEDQQVNNMWHPQKDRTCAYGRAGTEGRTSLQRGSALEGPRISEARSFQPHPVLTV